MSAMNPTKRAAKRDESINLRLSAADLSLIDNAAAAAGKTRSEFMLDCARQRAADAILDRRLFSLDAPAFAAFVKALDRPAKPNASSRRCSRESRSGSGARYLDDTPRAPFSCTPSTRTRPPSTPLMASRPSPTAR